MRPFGSRLVDAMWAEPQRHYPLLCLKQRVQVSIARYSELVDTRIDGYGPFEDSRRPRRVAVCYPILQMLRRLVTDLVLVAK